MSYKYVFSVFFPSLERDKVIKQIKAPNFSSYPLRFRLERRSLWLLSVEVTDTSYVFISEELDPQSGVSSTSHLHVGFWLLHRSSRSHFITSRVRSNRTSGQTITVHQYNNQNIKFTKYSEASNG